MATLVNRNGVWYARFRHDSKEYLRSTKVAVPEKGVLAIKASKEKAEAELHRIRVEISGNESVDALFARLNEAIEKLPESERAPRRINMSDRLRQGVTNTLPITDAWDVWTAHPNRGSASDATVRMYGAYWGCGSDKNGFVNWLKKHHGHVKAIHEVTRAIAEEYAAHLKAKKIAPRTYNGAITFLKSMFKTLKTQAGLSDNVWDGISRVPKRTEGRRNLTSEELNKVCQAAAGDIRYLIALGLYTGLRLGDCVMLKWNVGKHVNGSSARLGVLLEKKLIRIIPSKTSRKEKMIAIPMHPVLFAMLSELRQNMIGNGYLFPALADTYTKGDSAKITNRIQKLFMDCGIETTEELSGRSRVAVRVGFHSLRHSFVSLCAANKVPQVAIQDLVGHGSPAMTALYTHSDEKQRAEAIGALPAMVFKSA